MKTEADKNVIWNEAAKAGLWLGLFSGAVIIINALLASCLGSTFWARLTSSVISVALWLVKFIGCLWLLRFFMLKFAQDYSGVTNRMTFRFGMLTALTSALIVSAISLANMLLISPESMKDVIDTAMQSYSSVSAIGDSDRVAIERMMSWLPQISFFSSFIYCFLYGTVVSRIFSSGIPAKDIFSENRHEEN